MERKAEIEAKKKRLAELRREKELRLSENAGSLERSNEIGKNSRKQEIDDLLANLLLERKKTPGQSQAESPVSGGDFSEFHDLQRNPNGSINNEPRVSSGVGLEVISTTIFDRPPKKLEPILYSKAIQTNDDWDASEESLDHISPENYDFLPNNTLQTIPSQDTSLSKNLENNEDEKLVKKDVKVKFLGNETSNSVLSSNELNSFLDQSTKIMERAFAQDYDILIDYGSASIEKNETNNDINQVADFYINKDKGRTITSLDWSYPFPELVLSSYSESFSANELKGLVRIWNLHSQKYPEYTFNFISDILTAKFSPFDSNLIIGGSYSGNIVIWDIRASSDPILQTPISTNGHTHPIYSLNIIGSQNVSHIASLSTDGTFCTWELDMLAKPQKSLQLNSPPGIKPEDIGPLTMDFPKNDPSNFIIGSQSGNIFWNHVYDSAEAKSGVDSRIVYKSHNAPVTSLDFHPSHGLLDFSDLFISSSLDWTVKLWRLKQLSSVQQPSYDLHSSTMSSTPNNLQNTKGYSIDYRSPTSSLSPGGKPSYITMEPLLDFPHNCPIYDVKWSPIKPGVFALVDGNGQLEIWDLSYDTESPYLTTYPSREFSSSNNNNNTNVPFESPSTKSPISPTKKNINHRSLKCLSWEKQDGRKIATGGLDGYVSVFDVGPNIGGKDGLQAENWTNFKEALGNIR